MTETHLAHFIVYKDGKSPAVFTDYSNDDTTVYPNTTIQTMGNILASLLGQGWSEVSRNERPDKIVVTLRKEIV